MATNGGGGVGGEGGGGGGGGGGGREEFEVKEEDVAALKHWLYKQTNLPQITGVDEDTWLLNYLKLCKNRPNKAKTGLDLYFRLRAIIPQVFEDRDASTPEMESSFANTCLAYLPTLTPEGNRVVIYTHFNDDVSKFDPLALSRRILMLLDLQLKQGITHQGIIVLMDLHNSRRGHIARYPLAMLNKLLTYGWKAYPERLAGVHILNPPPFLEMALNIFKPFLKEKLRQRIKVHSNLKSLHQEISPKILPSEFGGAGASLQEINRNWQKKMIEEKEWLAEAGNHKVKDINHNGTNFNMEHGSFRKLSID
ncbi:clavesin-2-like [Nilaparvata lugens]|uniref:clavesin-2-like n=1 Tax=Nilaparvata lugens TaxID=108931 RepID=UPI00193D9C7B|nr:clavesin-2-like [Nilaparvata lugens]